MFKKLFLAGLALMLVLGLAFQAMPALAMSPVDGMVVDPNPPVLAQIQRVVLLESYPPQLRITGTLPSSCYQLRVSVPPLGDDPKPNLSALPLTVWVRGVYLRGSVCSQVTKTFSTTVTLDPAKLNLAPGKYVAMVNPVNGRSPYRAEFTVRPPYVEIVPVTIRQIVTLESYPPRYRLSGTVPATCYEVRASAPRVDGHTISVVLQGYLPLGMPCSQTVSAFTKTVTIDPVKLKLAPGTYTILFNPNPMGTSKFKATLTVPK